MSVRADKTRCMFSTAACICFTSLHTYTWRLVKAARAKLLNILTGWTLQWYTHRHRHRQRETQTQAKAETQVQTNTDRHKHRYRQVQTGTDTGTQQCVRDMSKWVDGKCMGWKMYACFQLHYCSLSFPYLTSSRHELRAGEHGSQDPKKEQSLSSLFFSLSHSLSSFVDGCTCD